MCEGMRELAGAWGVRPCAWGALRVCSGGWATGPWVLGDCFESMAMSTLDAGAHRSGMADLCYPKGLPSPPPPPTHTPDDVLGQQARLQH